MPELPDIEVYLSSLRPRIGGQVLQQVRLWNPFLLRSVEPELSQTFGKIIIGLRRIGKRIVLELEDELRLVLHLMIAGRLHWKSSGAKPPGKIGLAAFDFPTGSLMLTEAGNKRRASLYVVKGLAGMAQHDPGGLEVLSATSEQFAAALRRENHTLKRALTDPTILAGIGNSYSDEILHRAGLSPFAQTQKLPGHELQALFAAVHSVLHEWLDRLQQQTGHGFPERVTAFRPEMAVHGRFRKPCPVCHTAVQRIIYADYETNYCPRCQTGGKILADRSLSRLLKDDWPQSIEMLEERRGQ